MSASVTGAGSGIGKRLAELLLARGHDVVAMDVNFSDAARADLNAAGKVHFETVDVRDGMAVKTAVEAGVAALGAPTLVINCAGVVIAEPFTETDEAAFRRVVDINLNGSRNVSAAVLPHLRETRGHLVLFSSMAGFVANYGYSAYCASKFGVVGMAEVLRLEEKPNGVNVSVVAPPEIMTPMVEEERAHGSKLTGQMKQFAGSLELDPATRAILKGIDDGGFLIIPGGKARSTRILNRLAPIGMTHAISDRLLAKARRSG